MRSVRVPVSGWAVSTLTAYAEEDWSEEDPGIEAVCAAYQAGKGRALVVSMENAAIVCEGLVTLSNTEDEAAERRNTPPETRRMARWASLGLSGLHSRVWRAADALKACAT